MIQSYIDHEETEYFTPNFWQSEAWENAKKDSGCKSFWVENKNAKALVIERKTHWLKFWNTTVLWEIPRGPIGNFEDFPELISSILIKAKKEKISTVRIFPPFGNAYFWNNFDTIDPKKISSNYTWKPMEKIFSTDTLMINLESTEEEILAQMKQKGRYNIRLATKKGVEVFEEKNIDNFWKIMMETSKRDGFTSHHKKAYTQILKSFGDDAVLLSAKDSTGEVLASMIFTYIDGFAVYYYGASSNRKRNLMAPYILQWEGMKWAKKKGAKIYDFLGISPENSPEHSLESVSGFKHKFGGERVTCDMGRDYIL